MRLARAVVATTSPLTVTLDGATTAVSAVAIEGQSVGVGNAGVALVAPGQLPIFIRTA